MTPKREKYLARCSKREKWFRMQIEDLKKDIKGVKRALTLGYVNDWNITWLRKCKFFLTIYRHELQRLKGMDRVVVIGDDEPFVNTLTSAEYWTCKCGTGIYGTDNYCSNCGKRILRRR